MNFIQRVFARRSAAKDSAVELEKTLTMITETGAKKNPPVETEDLEVSGTEGIEDPDFERDVMEEGPRYNCPFGNGVGGCTIPECAFEDENGERKNVPTSEEWVRRPDYTGD